MKLSSTKAVAIAPSVYLVWFALTYLLEGWTHSFLQPEAVVEHEIYRITHFVVANVIVGTILTVLAIRFLAASHFITSTQAGFRSFSQTLTSIIMGSVLGFIIYALGLFGLEPPSLDIIVMLNAYAQMLGSAIAATLVCWALVGTVFESITKMKGKAVSAIVGILTSSVLFGIYHLALAPPNNTFEAVIFTTVLVGVATSLFFFISHDIYGTIVFSNFQWMFGVLHGQASSGNLGAYDQPMYNFYIMALVSVIVLITMDMKFIRRKNITNQHQAFQSYD